MMELIRRLIPCGTMVLLAACSSRAPTPDTALSLPTEEQPAEAPIASGEVNYFTPAQGEGPYYPVEKLADQDNDLTEVAGSSGFPEGEVIEFSGKVYDASGTPAEGIVVEIWQTDSSGVYLHPNDPGTDRRDRNFQFYGESVTDTEGSYDFRTILPGRYEPRPRHIHVKVRRDDEVLLTTQFYFEGDPELEGEAMFSRTGGDGRHLVISLSEGTDANGRSIWVGRRDIILNADLSG